MKAAPKQKLDVCQICFSTSLINICRQCQTSVETLTINKSTQNKYGHVQSIFQYDGLIVDLVRRAKISNDLDAMMALFQLSLNSAHFHNTIQNYDYLVPIPSSFRSRIRGKFDIPAWFCERYKKNFSANTIHLPWAHYFFKAKRAGSNNQIVSPSSILKSQVRRWHEHKPKGFMTKILGKNVLLVDDVITTGFTLSEAQRYLLQCGAKKVDGFVVGNAQRK